MTQIKKGPVHRLPQDLSHALNTSPKAMSIWKNTITPLAKNEWICFVTSPKKPETRKHRILRTIADLQNGKRRPCCWPGCPHR